MVRRSFWTISLIVILALAGMGVAYGLWFQNLFITGTVTTGTLGVALQNAVVTETEAKDVGTCTATISDEGEMLNVKVDNAYPGYICDVAFEVANTGTIPVHLAAPMWDDEAQMDNDDFKLVQWQNCWTAPYQLHNTAPVGCTLRITFTNTDDLAMGTSYDFAYRIMASQYNEMPEDED